MAKEDGTEVTRLESFVERTVESESVDNCKVSTEEALSESGCVGDLWSPQPKSAKATRPHAIAHGANLRVGGYLRRLELS